MAFVLLLHSQNSVGLESKGIATGIIKYVAYVKKCYSFTQHKINLHVLGLMNKCLLPALLNVNNIVEHCYTSFQVQQCC